MNDFIKWVRCQSWFITCLLFLAVIAAASILAECEEHRQKRKLEEINAAINGLIAQPVLLDVLDDSSRVYTAPVATVSRSKVKKLLPSKSLLKDINVKSSQVAAVDITANEVCDSVKLQPPDSVMLANGAQPSEFSYHDKWVDFRFSASDSVLRYSVRDSITTVVIREYKHRFLFWRWGTKGYHIKMVNHNPHSTLRYKQYINTD